MAVHVAMMSGCMGPCVKQVLLLARTCIFHTSKQPHGKYGFKNNLRKVSTLGPKKANVSYLFLTHYSMPLKMACMKS